MAEQSGWRLESLTPEMGGKQFEIKGSMSIGRAQESDICIALIGMSRRHARVTVCQEGLLVEDLNSSNGTYINNARIEHAVATAGDVIGFDTLQFAVIGPNSDVYSEKTSVRPAIDPKQIPPPKPAPMGPTAIEKQIAALKKMPPKGLGEEEPVFLKRKSHLRKNAPSAAGFLDSEWGRFTLVLGGMGALLGLVVIVANTVGT